VSEQAFFWIAGIMAVIVAAIGGALWKHISADSDVREKFGERVAKNETLVDHHETEIINLRKGQHDFKDEIKRASWMLIQDEFGRQRDEIRRIIREEK
jgi:hypothetical protein